MTAEEWTETLRPWLREAHAPAFDAALEWLRPRCRTEEEQLLAPALLLLLSPLNALVAPCRPIAGSCVNFQVTMSRQSAAGPERVRLTVRAGESVQEIGGSGVQEGEAPGSVPLTLWLYSSTTSAAPLECAARVLGALLRVPS